MEVKAIAILTTVPDATEEDLKFINAGFAIQSDNKTFLEQCIEMSEGKPTYNGLAIKAFLHSMAYGVAAAIRHGISLGLDTTAEGILEDLTADIKDALRVMDGVKEWHEIRSGLNHGKPPSKN